MTEAIERDAEALRAIHARVTELDPTGADAAASLARELAEVIAIVGRLEQLCDTDEPDLGDWGEHLEPTQGGPDALAIGTTLTDHLWRQVANVAFAARSELRRAERFLETARGDQRPVAAESARRKLRRAIHAVLGVGGQALGRPFPLTGLDGDIEAAIAVRRMYAKFRRSVPVCDPDDAAQVRRALRLTAVSLAVVVGSADFGEIRAQDRQLLLGLQARILAWARDGASDSIGRQLYLDVQTAADLLRAIERRQELLAHDRVVIEQMARALTSDDGTGRTLTELRPLLHALAGKDDDLDDLSSSANRLPAEHVLRELRARLTFLGWYPPAIAA